MEATATSPSPFNVVVVGQQGRLAYEAVLLSRPCES